jgi:hypothetical protein
MATCSFIILMDKLFISKLENDAVGNDLDSLYFTLFIAHRS